MNTVYTGNDLLSVTRKGKEGAEEIRKMMETYRTAPPKTINNSMVVMIKDYLKQTEFDFEKHTEQKINLPKSDVLQFFLKDGSKISVRPSGTEPKIKFYFSVREDFKKGLVEMLTPGAMAPPW